MKLEFEINTVTAIRAINAIRKYDDYLPYLSVSQEQIDSLLCLLDQLEYNYEKFRHRFDKPDSISDNTAIGTCSDGSRSPELYDDVDDILSYYVSSSFDY